MILKRIKINQFTSFKDTELVLDPKITTLVGRNDVGKTSLFSRLLEQTYSQGGFASADLSRVPEVGKEGYIHYEMIWSFDESDNQKFELPKIFGVPVINSIRIITEHRSGMIPAKDKYHTYEVNGEPFEAYKDKPVNNILPLRDEIIHFKQHILPKVRYITLSERQLLLSIFEIKFYKLPEGAIEVLPSLRRDMVKTENVLIRLMGLRGMCREVKGTEKPWDYNYPFPDDITIEEIKTRCAEISKEITELLNKWWDSPPNLTFSFSLANPGEYHKSINSFIGQIKVQDNHELLYYGTGLRWFITFLIEYLDIQKHDKGSILLFDEPANNLHPSAQKMVVQILNKLSDSHQIIYATHSPFMLDWYAPQRIRVIERDYYSSGSTKVSKITNKPYISGKLYSNFWWPLRDSIGLSLGDIGLLGDSNLLVEGESDKILLANIARYCKDMGKKYLDLNIVNVISANAQEVLAEQIVQLADSQKRKIIGLFDSDADGKKLKSILEKNGKEALELDSFVDNNSTQCSNSIEDLIGINDYVRLVNKFYTENCSSWFRVIASQDITKIKINSGNTLGKILENYFIKNFGEGHKFSKVSVAIYLASELSELNLKNISQFESLFEEIGKRI